MASSFHVYILASQRNGTLYIGMTNNLSRRLHQHRNRLIDGFTKKYDVKMLVHYETYDSVATAIQRETSLKRWPRRWKTDLIESHNPMWKDLAETAMW